MNSKPPSKASFLFPALILGITISLPVQAAVLSPDATFAGKTLYEWSAQWWKTFLEAPFDNNPLLAPDPTGSSLTAINVPSSPVFFLTGIIGGGAVNRSVRVSEKQAVFFPLTNFASVQVEPDETAESLCSGSSQDNVDVSSLFAIIDGQSIGDLGSQRQNCQDQPDSGGFLVDAPPDSLLAGLAADLVQQKQNLAVSDGFYLMVEPLTPGQHTITFGGEIPDRISQNHIYTIAVFTVPEPSSMLSLLAFSALSARLLKHKWKQQQSNKNSLS